MKRLLISMLALCIYGTAFSQIEAIKRQGDILDGYKILVSSNGTCPEGFTITRDILFFTSYPIVTRNFYNPYSESTDWVLTVDGSTYDVWIDSSANVLTSGVYEAYKIAATQGRPSVSIDGRQAGNAFIKAKEFLSGWATCYMLTTK